jgi:hypothetical protein
VTTGHPRFNHEHMSVNDIITLYLPDACRNVSHNQLSGAVVIDNIFNLSAYNITTLDLSSNNLSGAFPDLSKLSNSAIQL